MAHDTASVLPADHETASLVGRVWRPDLGGPSVVTLRDGMVLDITDSAPTCAELLNRPDPAGFLRSVTGDPIGPTSSLLDRSREGGRTPAEPALLAPCDLQALKACGVTFVRSMLERVIEERAGGDPNAAADIRRRLVEEIGIDLAAVKPGSEQAAKAKAALQSRGLWSQYLEVGIGPDAEVFTKAQPMSAVGYGAEIGIHPGSSWNNPEPEVVLAIGASGRIVGATLGNDVNLRDVEGRSALLLGKAKDNNASCAIGPFIRLFDQGFGPDDVRQSVLRLHVEGPEGFVLDGASSMREISRDIEDLAAQAINANHQYPDGLLLFTGTMFAPVEDRDAPGEGFTHKLGDVVSISSERLGTLTNTVTTSDTAGPWTYGTGALMRHLAQRGVL